MGLPNSIDKSTPKDSDNPSAGAAEIRNLKTFVEDYFNVKDGISYTASPFTEEVAGRVNVREYPYNAVGDGSADDTAAFVAAQTALGANGGVITIPPGTYRMNLSLSNMVTLQGSGARTTFLTPAINSPVLTLDSTSTSLIHCRVRNCGFTPVAGFTSTAIKITGANINDWHEFYDLYFPYANAFANAFYIDGRCIWSTWNRVEAEGATGKIFHVNERKTGAVFMHNNFVDCAFNNGTWGVYIDCPTNVAYTLTFTHCNFQSNSSGGFYADGIGASSICDSYFEDEPYHVYLTGAYAFAFSLQSNLLWGASNTAVYNHAVTSMGLYSGNRIAGTIYDWDIENTDTQNSNIVLMGNYDNHILTTRRRLLYNVWRISPGGLSGPGEINVKGFGALGDGITDDTAAIQAAIASNPNGATILFPPGTYLVSDTLALSGSGSYILEGTSTRATKLQWGGDSTTSLITITGLYFCKLSNLHLVADDSTPCQAAIELKAGCSELQFDNMFIDGGTAGEPRGFTKGFSVTGASACDAIIWNGVRIGGCTYAYHSSGGQARLNVWIAPCFMYNDYAVYWDAATGYGPFTMIEPYFAFSTECDLTLVAGPDSINIIGGRGEGSTRFLKTNSTGFTFPVNIQGFAWASNNLHVDGKVIQYWSEGQLTIQGCWFGVAQAHSPVILEISDGRLNLVGSVLRADSAVIPISLLGGGDFQCINTRRFDNAGVHTWFTDRVMFRGATQTTVGAAGGATALPATPTGYKEIVIAGTSYVVPYYAKV